MSLEGLQNIRYRPLHLLGKGGMGEVYLAEDRRINRQVAVKVVRTEITPYPATTEARDAIRLFQREAQTIATLNHPHILPLFDYGEEVTNETTIIYMVMPFCQEGSFAFWLRQRSNPSLLEPKDVVQLVRQAADALQYAHDQQIVHRDVKPSNFLIRSNRDNPNCPDLLLADFGVAKLTTENVSQIIRGTPMYMAPEQWDGISVPATDQYALAVMAYDLLIGHPPFVGNQGQVMYQHLTTQPQAPSTLNPQLPPAIDAVILRALAKQPEARFASISDFAHAFEQALLGVHESVPRTYEPPLPPYAPSQSRSSVLNFISDGKHTNHRQGSNKGRALLLIGLALLVIGVSIASIFVWSHQRTVSIAHATATAQANVTATAVASQYPFSNTLVLDDPLTNNNRGHNWMENSSNSGGTCQFTGAAYHASETQSGYFNSCYAQNTQFSNFTYQVEMTIIQGDAGGIVFRANSANSNFYYLRLDSDGFYALRLYVDGTGATSRLLKSGFSTEIALGPNETNLLAIVARNDTMDVYVNKQYLASVTDSTYSMGQIGVTAEDLTNSTEVVFSNAKVWKL
jgi:serine/threonine protein kinase